ncbi:MAG: Glycosyltransferase, group 2 family [candidate division WWE3 bacterium GW2011_GWF2_41_45]|uniref:Glycosyltransferase, group 2 family n=1 Tax=candidate division WWE3 bacterium GW2011_GWC2_41_23 TaxID=1619123 RepID=A0A0G0VRF4_UNCKA|nr:MAG: Glycosyltransferase, group 2 family [candidate division WWE3 bacterium GW2011_GWC2_41_23]KKS10108.1 MAG: Glycosyltransferase, group 2 family [candidate division WWE3 bacterium GW2011_GWF2_41_45]
MVIGNHYNKPNVSVVMGVYNGEKYLHEAIESVLNQTYRNFEFIIVNDGSTDNTEKIILRYKNKDDRIKYLKNKLNVGQSKTWNLAIDKSRGKYIARMDADDICLSNRFEEQIKFLNNNPNIDVLGTQYFIINANEIKSIKSSLVPRDLRDAKPSVHHPTCILKKELFVKFGKYNSKFDGAEDLELWYRFYSNGVNFYNINKYLFKYRIHGNNVSVKKIKRQVYLQLKINILGIFKYHINFSFKGYVYICEQFLYLAYLSLGLDKIFKKYGAC